MQIYVNGDSNCAGAELNLHEKTFADLLAQHYDARLTNHGESGCSNHRILRTTKKYLEQNTPDLVIIGWSTWEREEWEYQGKLVQINRNTQFFDQEFSQRIAQWHQNNTQDNLMKRARNWHSMIYDFHCELQEQNIPHLFFNCYFDFFTEPTQQKNWEHCFFEPYHPHGNFYWWLNDRGFVPTKDLHHLADAHSAWAKNLIDFIDNHACLRKR